MTAHKAPAQTSIDTQELLLRLRKADAVFDLTRGVGHEINNMMQTIMGSLELTRKLIGTGRVEETARFIEKSMVSARNAASLMDVLVGFSRRRPVEPQSLSMNEVIAGMEPILRAVLPRSVKLTLALGSDVWETYCDKHEAEVAILDLLLQARDALPAPDAIAVHTENVVVSDSSDPALAAGDYVRVAIGDSTRVHTTTPRAVDAGDLDPKDAALASAATSVVNRFAYDSGGGIKIIDAGERGASVLVYLPRHILPAAAR